METIGTIEHLGNMADALGVKWTGELDDEGETWFEIECEYADENNHHLAGRFTPEHFHFYLRGRVDERDAWKRVADHYLNHTGKV